MTETLHRRGCMWLGLRISGGLLLLLLVLAGVGALYESRALAADRARYPPPGELAPVIGRQMHI